jgi:hypothetical protein
MFPISNGAPVLRARVTYAIIAKNRISHRCQVRFTLVITIILCMLLVPCYLTVPACAVTRGRNWNKHPGAQVCHPKPCKRNNGTLKMTALGMTAVLPHRISGVSRVRTTLYRERPARLGTPLSGSCHQKDNCENSEEIRYGDPQIPKNLAMQDRQEKSRPGQSKPLPAAVNVPSRDRLPIQYSSPWDVDSQRNYCCQSLPSALLKFPSHLVFATPISEWVLRLWPGA